MLRCVCVCVLETGARLRSQHKLSGNILGDSNQALCLVLHFEHLAIGGKEQSELISQTTTTTVLDKTVNVPTLRDRCQTWTTCSPRGGRLIKNIHMLPFNSVSSFLRRS